MHQVEAVRYAGIDFICLVTFLLCLCVLVYVVAAAPAHRPLICQKGQIVLGGLLYRGNFVLGAFFVGGFLTGGLWFGGFCPGAFSGCF